MTALRLACVQVSPGANFEANLESAIARCFDAIQHGAEFVLLPEFATFLHSSGRVMREATRPEAGHPALETFGRLARQHRTWILLGSLTVTTDEDRIANRSFLFDAEGSIAAHYDKIHMFDARLPTGRTIRESSLYRPGERAVVASTPWGAVGLTICYDLRFPKLYRELAIAGAQLIVVPSAFTHETGAMHWHALLRARAIENGCFVAAPATCGTHPGEHRTFGHSVIVDPLGRIVAEAGDEPEVIVADIDLDESARVRSTLPVLEQERAFRMVTAPTDAE